MTGPPPPDFLQLLQQLGTASAQLILAFGVLALMFGFGIVPMYVLKRADARIAQLEKDNEQARHERDAYGAELRRQVDLERQVASVLGVVRSRHWPEEQPERNNTRSSRGRRRGVHGGEAGSPADAQ